MTGIRDRRRARASRRRISEQGLTLIELLLSLAVLVILTSFLAGGLLTGRRAFEADRSHDSRVETDAAIQALLNLVGTALPIPAKSSDKNSGLAFDGRPDSLSFVGLSEGRSLRGGPNKFSLRRNGSDLLVDVASERRAGGNAQPSSTQTAALGGVRAIRFGYFGTTDPSAPPAWRNEWTRMDRLPDLVSIRIDFADERRNQPAAVIALRQR